MIVCGQAAHIWVCRTTTVSIFQHGIFSNRVTNVGVVIALLLGCFVTYLPGKRSIRMIVPTDQWGSLLCPSFIVLMYFLLHPIVFLTIHNASMSLKIMTSIAVPAYLRFYLHLHLYLTCSLTCATFFPSRSPSHFISFPFFLSFSRPSNDRTVCEPVLATSSVRLTVGLFRPLVRHNTSLITWIIFSICVET